METWSRQKDFWLTHRISSDKLLDVVTLYSMRYPEDRETLLWLSSRGVFGSDEGGEHTFEIAEMFGFTPRPN
jgi:hypothetical protein